MAAAAPSAPGSSSSAPQKQYAVIPLDRVIQQQAPALQELRQQIETTSNRDLPSLDAQIRRILSDSGTDDNTKAVLVRALVLKLVQAAEQSREPFKFPIEIEQTGITPTDELVKNLRVAVEKDVGISSLPRARRLINLLLEIKEFGWNEKYELTLRGVPVPGSNIVSLIIDAAKPHRKSVPAPVGWYAFYSLLSQNRVSEAAIGNKARYVNPLQQQQEQQMQVHQIPVHGELISTSLTSPTIDELPAVTESKLRKAARKHSRQHAPSSSSMPPTSWEFQLPLPSVQDPSMFDIKRKRRI
jgi:hypothetical protein